MVRQYLHHNSYEDIDKYILENEGQIPIAHYFIRRAIEVGLDGSNND